MAEINDEIVTPSTVQSADTRTPEVKTLTEVVQDMKDLVPKLKSKVESIAETKKIIKTRTRSQKVQVKLTDADVIIQSLQNMIEVVEYVKQVQCPEIKDTSAKVTRDLMVEFRKEIDNVKAKYLQQIQQL